MRSVRYHEAARAEFLHEVAYFSRLSVRLGQRYDRAVMAAEACAAETPELGAPYKQKTRRVVDRTFKFSFVLYTATEILVLAIAPFRRKPSYWQSRLSDD